jgi:uncharacterized protein YndB with AHSA1/START domain
MPKVARSRFLPVAAGRVCDLIADPHNLPRWWPETVRVESVDGAPGARRSRFTQVFETRSGTPVRADYRCTESTRGERLLWEQQIEGTPFEKFLRAAELEFRIGSADEGTRVTVEGRRLLRGLSRLGGPMMSRATKRSLDDVLDGIERALLGDADEEQGAIGA